MAENDKYNLKNMLLEADEKLKGSLSLLGMSMLTQPAYNNSMRSVMFTSHLKQFLNLLDPDFPGFFTNGENVVGKYSSGYKKTENTTEVYRKISKYGDIIDNPFVYTLFVYDRKKKKYDVWERKEAENLTEMFGFQYNNDVIDSLKEGDVVEKDTIVYKSESYDDENDYCYGKNIRMIYNTDPFTSEDACLVAESMAKYMMNSIEVNKVSIGINQNDYLLNIKGDNNEYKPMADLGEYVDGEIAAKRTLSKKQLLSDFKTSSLQKINDSDVCYYGTGKIIDITIYCNNSELEETPFTSQIIKYIRSQKKYYSEIKDTCEEIIKSGEKYTHNLDYLYKRACAFLNEDAKWKTDTVFSNLLIEVTIKSQEPLQKGQKLTGRYGNKSVVAKRVPDDEMPFYYDDNGNKQIIHLIFNVLAIINRTTAFPIYELSINFICNKVRSRLQQMKTRKEKENLLFGVINDLNEKQAKEMKDIYMTLSSKEKDEYIQDCIDNRIYIHQPPLWETKPIFYRMLEIYKKYDFLTPYDLYINKWGRDIPLINKSYVGEMYILKLKQTSRKGFSARSTGSINSKGLPEKSYKNKSFTELRSSTPIRFGEFETLNFSIGVMPEDIQLFHALYRTSLEGRRDLAEYILSGSEYDNFEIAKSYNSRTAEIFAVLLKALGLRIEFINNEEELREYDDSEIKMHVLDGIEYLCTEYQFMLVKRRKAIEKEILKEYGVIDKDLLNKLVYDELMNRNYVMGPDKEDYKNTPGLQPDTLNDF